MGAVIYIKINRETQPNQKHEIYNLKSVKNENTKNLMLNDVYHQQTGFIFTKKDGGFMANDILVDDCFVVV